MIRANALKFLLLSSTINSLVDATSIKMDYLPIGHARVDPILRDDCLSDHVHTFYGPQSGVDPRRIDSSDKLELHSKLVNTPVSENTGNVEENKSLYWHPTVYKVNPNTKKYIRDKMYQTSAYYVWETGVATAFPNGFRMIAGFDPEKSQAVAECVNKSPCDQGDCYTENTFFPKTKCEELEVSMRMPSCWDGVSIDSPPAHTDHVEYPNEEGDCPDSHPVHIPRIEFFFRIINYDGGWHTFSDGSSVFHADYVSGWDEDFLQNLLDNCENEGDGAMPNFFCEDILTYRDGPKCTNEETCDFGDPNLNKKLKRIQPSTPLDVQGTIVAEETSVVETLPRGTCNGSLVNNGGGGGGGSGGKLRCNDDDDFLHNDNPQRDCAFFKTADGKKSCKNSLVFSSCPASCRMCKKNSVCKDKKSFRHKNKPERTCNWIKTEGQRFCKKKTIAKACPVACGLCS